MQGFIAKPEPELSALQGGYRLPTFHELQETQLCAAIALTSVIASSLHHERNNALLFTTFVRPSDPRCANRNKINTLGGTQANVTSTP